MSEAGVAKIHQESNRRAAEKGVRNRAKRLAAMAADQSNALGEAETLSRQQNREAYGQIATLLVDLREALAGKL